MHSTQLDDSEFVFQIMFGGMKFGNIVHRYHKAPDGSEFYAETELGSQIPVIGWLINWFILPFVYNKKTAEYWIRRNIEETGRTKNILPVLYEYYHK